MHQFERQSQRGLEADDSVGRMREYLRGVMRPDERAGRPGPNRAAELFHLLRLRIVRRMIGCDYVDRTVANRSVDRFDIVVDFAAEDSSWRWDPKSSACAFVQREMMRRDLASDLRAVPPSGADQVERLGRRHVGDVNERARANRNREIAAHTLRFR